MREETEGPFKSATEMGLRAEDDDDLRMEKLRRSFDEQIKKQTEYARMQRESAERALADQRREAEERASWSWWRRWAEHRRFEREWKRNERRHRAERRRRRHIESCGGGFLAGVGTFGQHGPRSWVGLSSGLLCRLLLLFSP
jgi:hypothetical protein